MRNLCLLTLLVVFGLAAMRAPAGDTDPGFTSLFNGKDLSNFEQKGGKAKYRIEGDAIVGPSSRTGGVGAALLAALKEGLEIGHGLARQ